MIKKNNQSGFSAIELLITLFIAAAFLISGYQIFSLIVKDGASTRTQAKVGNVVYDYLQRYKDSTTNPCTEQSPKVNEAITITDVPDSTVSVTISCPFGTSSQISKVLVEVKYGDPQQTISNATYVHTCPVGFIPVPGSATYGTSDFCVMKYEAKADDNGDGIGDTTQTTGYNTWPADTYPISASRKLVSSAAGYPVANISQTTAISVSSTIGDVYGCASGCHLITEAEWMTIAQNVLSVASNWSSGIVGSGHIYSGHNNSYGSGLPNAALEADLNDSNGYAGEIDSNESLRRTLTLTNGQVIWDFSGNVYDWTSGQTDGISAQQPGVTGGGWAEREYTSLTYAGSLATNVTPVGTGISGASSWNYSNGIGRIYSNADDTTQCGFLRSGYWLNGYNVGVLTLDFSFSPGFSGNYVGLRVSQ